MNLNKSSQYALKILNYMVLNEGEIITSKILHDKLDIPYHYLRRLLTKLSGKKIIKGGKGRGGGYTIAKPLKSISLSEVISATGKKDIFISCIFGFATCPLTDKCILHDRWAQARENILNLLQTTRLSDLKAINTTKSKKVKKLNLW